MAMKLLTAAAEQSEISASSPSVSSKSLTSLLSSRVEVSSLDFEVDAIDQSPFRSFALRTRILKILNNAHCCIVTFNQ